MLFEQRQFSFQEPSPAAAGAQVRFSMRARRLSVRVFRNARVEVVAPPRTSTRRIAEFLSLHQPWIERQLARARELVAEAGPFPPPALELPALGERWKIHLAGGAGRLRIRELTPGVLNVSGHVEHVALQEALRRWLMRHAKPRIAASLSALVRDGGPGYRRLSLRCQRSRWGSCSVRGTISLNIAMLFQRAEVAQYLMIHELTHLEHPNHSARFWRAVEARCPQWRTLDRELTRGWRHVPPWLFA